MALVLDEEEGYDVAYLVAQIQGEMLRRGEGIRVRIESPVFVRKQRREKGSALAREALSEIVAAKAREWPEVEKFRQRVLGGRLLKAVEVGPWIAEIQKGESLSEVAYIVSVPPEANVQRRNLRWHLDSPIVVQADQIEGMAKHDSIAYGIPGNSWVQRKPIGRRGTLRELHDLCQTLANCFKWEDHQSTGFVLTDAVPRFSGFRCQVQPTMPIDALSRVALTIDLSMSPRELAQKYAKIRKNILSPKKTEGSTRKPRALSEKHVWLAAFAARIPNAELDEEDMKTWNRKHPRWRYGLFKNFNRAWKDAQRRLVKGPAAAFDYSKAFD